MINRIITSLSKYYPFSIEELRVNQFLLDWEAISQNRDIKWNDSIIEEFANKLNFSWDGLGMNPSLPLTRDFIKRFEKLWEWTYLTDNPAIEWSADLIEEFKEDWTWEICEFAGNVGLSLNRHLPWCIDLIDIFKDNWCWPELSCNPSLPWSKDLIERYRDHWEWGSFIDYGGLSNNPSPIVKNLLLKYYPERIDYKHFKPESNLTEYSNSFYDDICSSYKTPNEIDSVLLEYCEQYGLSKLINCINITLL